MFGVESCWEGHGPHKEHGAVEVRLTDNMCELVGSLKRPK